MQTASVDHFVVAIVAALIAPADVLWRPATPPALRNEPFGAEISFSDFFGFVGHCHILPVRH